ncbi:unnamed protein product [Brassica oleracea]
MLKRPFKVAATAKLPTFLPRDVERIKDTFALNREASRKSECFFFLHVSFSEDRIMSSCVTPLVRKVKSCGASSRI